MQRIERLPFTTYDVLGYLVPGSFFIIMILHFRLYDLFKDQFGTFDNMGDFNTVAFLFVVMFSSYIMGHIIAITSAIFTEEHAVYLIGYPSEYLMSDKEMGTRGSIRYVFDRFVSKKGYKSVGWYLNCLIIFFPYTLCFIILLFCGIGKSFIKPLPPVARQSMDEHLKKKICPTLDASDGRSWFLPLIHYCQNNLPHANMRMYNYIVIYGFLRHVSFVSYIFGLLYTLAPFINKVYSRNYGFSNEVINIYFGVSLLLVGFLSFLGFLKFFRRFSEEASMAFLLARKFD